MDDFFEILGPLIVGAIYVLGSIFSKKDKADDGPPIEFQNNDLEDEDYQRQVQVTRPKVKLKLKNPPQTSQTTQTTQTRHTHHTRQPDHATQPAQNIHEHAYEQESSFQDEMERQMQKIEETKRRAAQLLSQSAQQGIQSADNMASTRRERKKRSLSPLGSVRSSLKDPSAARTAFIYGEVLGQPVSLKETTGVPGLSS